MKRLKFKKPFNGMVNAKRLIPESYKIDGNEFEITDGIETYRIKWSTSLNEGTILMSSNKKLINEDMQKMKHLMGFKSQETLGNLKGAERINEDKKFGDVWNKTKGLLKEMTGDYDFPTTNNDSWKWEDRERMKHRIEAKFNNHNPRLKLINSEDHNRHSEFGNGNLVIVTNQSSPELEYKLQELASENEWGFESFLDGLYLMYQGNGYGNNNESLKEIHLEESDGEVDASVTNLMNYIKDTPKFGTLAGKINSPQKKIQAGVEYAKLVAGGDTALLSKIGSKIKAESGESDGQTNTDTSITNEGAFTNESEECNECGDMYEMDRFDEIFEGIYEEEQNEGGDLASKMAKLATEYQIFDIKPINYSKGELDINLILIPDDITKPEYKGHIKIRIQTDESWGYFFHSTNPNEEPFIGLKDIWVTHINEVYIVFGQDNARIDFGKGLEITNFNKTINEKNMEIFRNKVNHVLPLDSFYFEGGTVADDIIRVINEQLKQISDEDDFDAYGIKPPEPDYY